MSGDLKAAHAELKAALESMGVEVGPEVLAIWLDRQEHGQHPLPMAALRGLADWAAKQSAERP